MRILNMALTLLLFLGTVAYAGDPVMVPNLDEKEEMENALKRAAEVAVKENEESQKQRKFAGLDFGIGLSLTMDTGDHDRVKNADIVDGIVRVTKENNATARIMLESHYFFTPDKVFGCRTDGNFGWGPYIALQPGTDEIIEAIGLGLMIGFKRGAQKSGSWNFGLGMVVDPNVQILGDGFEENRPPPGTETQIRYKETDQWGVMFLSSFTF